MASGRLDGLSIVIVGGTSGLGLSSALACQRQGARLTVLGRDDEHAGEAASALGASVPLLRADATQPASASALMDLAVKTYGGIDGLVHVAGGSGRRFGDGPLDRISDDGWRTTLDINASSVFLSNRAVLRHFLQAGRCGAIVNVASVLGFSPAPAHFATHAYAAAKAAVIGLSQSAAAYYAPHDIRINVVAPALVDTPMAARAAADPAILEYIRTKQPLDGGRIGHPTDVDGAVVFLLSTESRFITGQVIAVDGGWTVRG
jgi:NAD(P)-dependent dehydrogenase (short-subunit alcohol dehydrogenase family)